MSIIATKPLVKSKSFWGGVIAILPVALELLPEVITQVLPVLSPQTQVIVSTIGGLITLFGTATRKTAIKGIFSSY